ncbi:energy transducer TonB [Phascolarctobacterium sp. Marseille-Q4147]|uniref:energy transducer TonB n=1 Tax=Phascolarctobacterium sp. Marseille-Q4147 TaxID=2823317 RepID=UPI001B3451ED|nr:energy transducer TonB [Phascolarctobacterium sp. Marseille-Q4147]QTV77725.1 energy transducer TonB [Phascolarctobacterium sp. Marseille-Q4147]
MKDEQKRFGKGFAVALAVHLVLAAGLGIFGYRFVHTPPEILEVSLEGGGGGAEAQEEEIEQAEQQEEPIIQSLEDIIDQKLKPKPQKKVVRKKATAAPGPKAPAGSGTGTGTGTGTGSGSGSGSGNGSGNGSGEGRGVPVKPPRLLREVAPVYPASARNSGATGVVTVRILVGADGSVEDVTVVGSSGNGAMDNSVVTAVNKWRFSPAKDKYGQNARCRVTRAVSFNLR